MQAQQPRSQVFYLPDPRGPWERGWQAQLQGVSLAVTTTMGYGN